ncbi:CDK5 regulatory subunit-associated protein 2-like isoform X1 [Lethenteron reissneri]|uniref:CDK5 regulatory subunit-associated protein 2-like isoform X1 n=2 Tax=Lethenteron reissneri TaxID=7753 RepID=UPI002AB7F06C|nr:CDK5 regulatory subunit-associated protein 2-like isoform X1 [Lethenteron reissneri]
MDSVVGDDPSLPGDLSSSLSRLHELTGVEPGGLLGMELGVEPGGPGGLAGGTQISPTRARTMKDYEQQIAELKKENFSLKLRIYFLEERVQEGCDGATEDVYRTNIELKVEVESLKRDLREKQNLLVKASNAVETLAGSREAEISRLHQQARQEMQQLQGQLRKLQEELEQGREELGHMARLAQAERERGLELEAELGELRASHQQQLQQLQLQQQSSLSPPPYQPQGQQQQQLQQLAHGREAHTGRRSVAVGPNDSPERAGATEERGGRASEGPRR